MQDQQTKTEIELYVIERVKELRNSQNLSQAKLAILIDVSVGFIGHVENPSDRAKYNLNHLNKLAKILNCSFKEFFPDKPFDFETK